jgi:lipopolysaccharide/colanic/teichoic acid biosynthesis glycosyltransferase
MDRGVRSGIPAPQAFVKRALDIGLSICGLLALGWLIVACSLISAFVHGGTGIFIQERVGRFGLTFPLIKLRTMRRSVRSVNTVTTADDPRITYVGRILRNTKIDELPQLLNVLVGHMSLVGPRPDVPGYADKLAGPDRIVLSVRPGVTGPASLAYRDEEALLAAQSDPQRFNREVIFPDKVRLNRAYVEQYSLKTDLVCLWWTLLGRAPDGLWERNAPSGDRQPERLESGT